MFHRVEDPLSLPSSRFFRMAERLELRGGAVTNALATAPPDVREEWNAPSDAREQQGPPRTAAVAEGTEDDIASIAGMSQHPGFPSIGYMRG